MEAIQNQTQNQSQNQSQRHGERRLSRDFVLFMDRLYARREPITPYRENGRLEYKWIFTLRDYYEMRFMCEDDYYRN